MPAPETNRGGSAPRDEAFFRIDVAPRGGFDEFRREPLDAGNIERVDGRRAGGAWETQGWLIPKRLAHVEGGRLIPDGDDARRVLDELDSVPEEVSPGVFRARLRRASAGDANARAAKFARRIALEKEASKKPPR